LKAHSFDFASTHSSLPVGPNKTSEEAEVDFKDALLSSKLFIYGLEDDIFITPSTSSEPCFSAGCKLLDVVVEALGDGERTLLQVLVPGDNAACYQEARPVAPKDKNSPRAGKATQHLNRPQHTNSPS
jgi:hypothetical protein